MAFFEPLPPEPAPQQRVWAPPLWDRPSEGIIPAVLAVNEVVHRSDNAVVTVDYLNVYPNGFVIQMAVHFDPRRAEENVGMMRQMGP